MPGIAGFISTNVHSRRETLDAMRNSMLHEASYNSGMLVEKALGLAVAWVSHQGSFADCLPVWNETHELGLIFTGEEFTETGEFGRPKAAGHPVAGSNASYLVRLYEKQGDRFFESLNGVFSGLVIDLRERKLVLFNDRYGLGRIYLHEGADALYFASEAKALLKVLPQLRRLEMPHLGELFTLGCVLRNRTIFSGITLLPSGSRWTFRPPRPVKKEVYFSRETWEAQEKLSPDAYYEKLKATFARVLPRYFRESEQTAMSLTGGLDSRMIMAWARRAPSTFPCYSHRGMFNECADVKIASRIAKLCDQPYSILTVGGSFFSEFPKLARQCVYITDGCMDASGAAGLFVNRIARKEIGPVRMTGNYGSEILRRLVAFKPTTLDRSLWSPDFAPHLNQARTLYRTEKQCDGLSFIAFKQVPWHHYSRFALEQSQLTVRSPYLDNELVAVAYQSPTDLSVNQHLAKRLITDGNPVLASFPTDRGPLGRDGFWGRISQQFEEFTFKAEYAFDYGMPQWLVRLDRALAPLHLEKLFLGRHKYYHYRYWYRHQLAPFVKEVLFDPCTLSRPYLDGRNVARMVNAHVTGAGNYTSQIHLLLTSELIQRQLIEQS